MTTIAQNRQARQEQQAVNDDKAKRLSDLQAQRQVKLATMMPQVGDIIGHSRGSSGEWYVHRVVASGQHGIELTFDLLPGIEGYADIAADVMPGLRPA